MSTPIGIALKLANSGQGLTPLVNLNFGGSALDSRITFTRASTATRTNSSGLIESVASGVPRFDYDPITLACKGLLIEEARTNLLTYSETPSSAQWTAINYVVQPYTTDTAAPNGALAATKLTAVATGSIAFYRSATITVSTVYTVSAYFKRGTAIRFHLGFSDNIDSGCNAFFDSTTPSNVTLIAPFGGWASASAGAIDVGNGWWRCWLTATSNSSDTSTTVYACPTNANNVTATAGDTCYVYGAQLEAGAFPTSYIPSSVTHTGRASTATFIGSNGLIQTAASGVARYSYNPLNLSAAPALLLEAASTNLLTRSEEFDNAAWTAGSGSVAANAVVAPDGTSTADKFTPNTTPSAYHFITQSVSKAASAIAYTGSIYFKSGGYNIQILLLNGPSTSGYSLSINSTTGAILGGPTLLGGAFTAPSYSIQQLSDGWWRASLSATSDTDTAIKLQVTVLSGSATTFTGDGTSGIYIWGAQIEQVSYPTSYIPTTSAQATRAADTSTSATANRAAEVATMTGTNFSSWWNATEGTFVLNSRRSYPVPSGQFPRMFEISSSVSNRMAVLFGGGTWYYVSSVFSGSEVFNTGVVRTETLDTQSAFGFKLNDYAFSVNGGAASTDTTGGVPPIDRLAIGCDWSNSSQFNGHIRSIRYYPARLSNTQLQALTL